MSSKLKSELNSYLLKDFNLRIIKNTLNLFAPKFAIQVHNPQVLTVTIILATNQNQKVQTPHRKQHSIAAKKHKICRAYSGL